jgi:hypothetical protein
MVGDSPLVSYFKQAKHYRAGGNLPPTRVVIHDMEYPLGKKGAEWCADYFHSGERIASAHYCVDADSVAQSVREADVAFHAPPNNHSIGIEQAGFSSMKRPDWLGPECLPELKLSANLCADICKRHGIPVVFLSPDDLKAGKRGITTHNNVSLAFHQSTHTDPGPNFPIDWYLDRVRNGEEDEVTDADLEKIGRLIDAKLKEYVGTPYKDSGGHLLTANQVLAEKVGDDFVDGVKQGRKEQAEDTKQVLAAIAALDVPRKT